MTMHVETDILTYKKWRAVCDDCEWSSPNFEFLSEIAWHMANHKTTAHQPVPVHRPAPPKLSEVISLTRKAIELHRQTEGELL